MAVIIGSARIDENGHAHGGKAGDQTGKEVSTQNWYLHSKGWRVFRAKSPAVAEKIAQDMQWACDNKHIGYDQYERNSLYKVAQAVGFNCSKVTTNCETDCSALVRVCCAYAGITGLPSDFRTINEASMLLKTGAFVEMKGEKYTNSSAYLKRGDILVTATHGHTVVVLTNGSKAGSDTSTGLCRGDSGADVRAMQRLLLTWNPDCLPKYGADGDFGKETEKAVKAFQTEKGLPATGIYDAATEKALKGLGTLGVVKVTGASVYVRSAPNTDGRVLGTMKNGDRLPYQGESKADARGVSWHLVEFNGENGWISEKFGKVE